MIYIRYKRIEGNTMVFIKQINIFFNVLKEKQHIIAIMLKNDF